jgi:hypothetical protein
MQLILTNGMSMGNFSVSRKMKYSAHDQNLRMTVPEDPTIL